MLIFELLGSAKKTLGYAQLTSHIHKPLKLVDLMKSGSHSCDAVRGLLLAQWLLIDCQRAAVLAPKTLM
jgi:hypothetical protein